MRRFLIVALGPVLVGLLAIIASVGLDSRATQGAPSAQASQPVAYAQYCSQAQPGTVQVVFLWTPSGQGQQWLDLSVFNNGFTPGTAVGVGPLTPDAWIFIWDGLLSNTTHYFRVNTLTASGWQPGATGYVTTGVCAAPPPQAGGGTCIESTIDGDFEGWDGDTLFTLSNGQFWQQASASYVYHYAYRPSVTICQLGDGYKMYVEGVDQSIYVTPRTCMETCIAGSFEGLRSDAVFDLCNGQVWQQESYYTWYHYSSRPSVTICQVDGGYKMWVEGIDESVYVVRLR